ncbi:hypothetical protein [uncultured Algimonas sp.]|nr:hypothetical protein [uncultured Algimonas sp.]
MVDVAKTSYAVERDDPVSWFARNSVAANLVMLALLIGGAFAALQIRQEV